jgi:hypothetical protein
MFHRDIYLPFQETRAVIHMGGAGWIRKEKTHPSERKVGQPRVMYCKIKFSIKRAQELLYNHQNDVFCKDIQLKRSESKRSLWLITCGCPDEHCNQQTVYKRKMILGSPNRM